MSIRDKVIRFKKIHATTSLIIFTFLVTYCLMSLPEFNLSDISLSRFGISEGTYLVWNIGLFILGVVLYLSVMRNVYLYHKDKIINKRLTVLFAVSTVMLLFTAIVDMRFSIHNILAILYFVGYTLSIFLFGYKLLESDFRMGMTSICVAIASMIVPILSLFVFPGLAIPEIVHTLFIFLWDLTLTFDIEYKNLLKKVGL